MESGYLSRKVMAIAAGEAHTLALAGDGDVYVWGRGTFGRLGTGSEEDQSCPVLINFDSGDRRENAIKIVGISAGAYHSLAVSDDGSVWCWGYNIFGFDGDNSLVPRLVEGFLDLGSSNSLVDESGKATKSQLMISSVKAGGMMSLAIDSLGALWIWGNCPQQNSSSEDGFSLTSSSDPIPVWNFHGRTVVKVACGNEHIVALVSAGETYSSDDCLLCYTWGNNSHGQLGLGDRESRLHPVMIEKFNLECPWAVYEIACGSFHTALLTREKEPSDMLQSMCWTFGLGDNGQLGHGNTQTVLSPKPVGGLPQDVFLVSVGCGLFHTCVVSSSGYVWSFGMERGLGLCPDASFSGSDYGDALFPLLISSNGSKFIEPVQIECGAAHTVLAADRGHKIWSWGRGWSGVLGNGKMVDCYVPNLVLWPLLTEDFKEEESSTVDRSKTDEEKDNKETAEMGERLSAAMEEVELLRSKLTLMERYASILHGSIFGKPFEEQDIPISLQNSHTFDVGKEWEHMLDSLDRSKLIRLEMFYRNLLAGVKDKVMKKRIQEMINECLHEAKTSVK